MIREELDRFKKRLVSALEPLIPPVLAPVRDRDERRRFFAERPGGRYWWHQWSGHKYVPDVYALLSDSEWDVLRAWFIDTDERQHIGECNVPLIGWLSSFVSANDVSRMVQLGTYAGYSTLLLGWAFRRMGKRNALIAVDIDPQMSAYTQGWIDRAGLGEYVRVHVGDSADPSLPKLAADHFGAPTQVLFIDSSHQYAHTLRELDLWYGALTAGSLILMHDTSDFASSFDSTGQGGVRRALDEWTQRSSARAFNLSYSNDVLQANQHVYRDGCGVGIVVCDKAPPTP